jgi:predicted ATPase/DNA-binding CsgD family transcriptional regulator
MVNTHYNLPVQLIPMIGREKEIGDLDRLFEDPEIRLISLHGLGGIGKTRLAIEYGQTVLTQFSDGVWFIALAPLESPELILSTVTSVLGFSPADSDNLKEEFLVYIKNKKLFLIMDNIEHLLPNGALFIQELLEKAPGIRLLVTSRQPLNALWEYVYPLRGLDYTQVTPGNSAAVKLFIHILRQSGADQSELDQNCVVQICRLVNGLPLALLLAASWGRALGCHDILTEIQRGIEFLQVRQQVFSERHRSIQAVFDYSWQLLSSEQQAALRRMAVFPGSFDRSAAEGVTGANLYMLASLVDQSLVERIGTNRYQIHQLLKQYLQDRMLEAGEEAMVHERHLAFYMELTEQYGEKLIGKDYLVSMSTLGVDIDNIRAALNWCIKSDSSAGKEKGMRLMVATERFWLIHLKEGYTYLLQLLHPDLEQNTIPSHQDIFTRGLILAAKFSYSREDLPKTIYFSERALEIAKSINDLRTTADVHYYKGSVAFFRGDYESANTLLRQALEKYQSLAYHRGIMFTRIALGKNDYFNGFYQSAFNYLSVGLELARNMEDMPSILLALRSLGELSLYDETLGPKPAKIYLEEALGYARLINNSYTIRNVFNSLAEGARLEANHEQALTYYEEAVTVWQPERSEGFFLMHLNLGFVYLHLGKINESKRIYMDALSVNSETGKPRDELDLCLLGMAGVLAFEGDAGRAAKIMGAIDAVKDEIISYPTDRKDYEWILHSIKTQLDEKSFAQLFKEGQAISIEEAVKLALIQIPAVKEFVDARLAQLTKREIEILRLVAHGLSDTQAAERLVISARTVNAHLTSIYSKLGVNSRGAATRVAYELGLV